MGHQEERPEHARSTKPGDVSGQEPIGVRLGRSGRFRNRSELGGRHRIGRRPGAGFRWCIGGLQDRRDSVQFLDRFGSLQFHKLMAIAGFDPADAEVRHQEARHVVVSEVGDEGSALPFAAVTADVAGGDMSTLL